MNRTSIVVVSLIALLVPTVAFGLLAIVRAQPV